MSDIINTVGRRKSSVARIYMKNGSGELSVNGRDYKDYFAVHHLIYQVEMPFIVTETLGNYDVKINVKGGGIKGQAEAIKLALARALAKDNEEFKPELKKHKLFTRDARKVERKKPGLRKARKKAQFSKR